MKLTLIDLAITIVVIAALYFAGAGWYALLVIPYNWWAFFHGGETVMRELNK